MCGPHPCLWFNIFYLHPGKCASTHAASRRHKCSLTDPLKDADWLFHIAEKEQPLAANFAIAPPSPLHFLTLAYYKVKHSRADMFLFTHISHVPFTFPLQQDTVKCISACSCLGMTKGQLASAQWRQWLQYCPCKLATNALYVRSILVRSGELGSFCSVCIPKWGKQTILHGLQHHLLFPAGTQEAPVCLWYPYYWISAVSICPLLGKDAPSIHCWSLVLTFLSKF